MRINRVLGTVLLTGISVLGISVFSAAGIVNASDSYSKISENAEAESIAAQTFTTMDEDGKIYEIEPEVGLVEEIVSPFSDSENEAKVVNFNTKGNATTGYIIEGMTSGSGGQVNGYTNGAYGADAAYLGMVGDHVRFMLSGVIGLVPESDVQVLNVSDVKTLSCYEVSGNWLIHRLCYNLNSSGHAGSLKTGPAPAYLKKNVTYYSYDGHYFYTDYKVMLEDYAACRRSNSVNPDDPYYNYFQYLPLRSASRYSGVQLSETIEETIRYYFESDPNTYLNSKMNGIGDTMTAAQDNYGVNALLMAGIAANESGWGTSSICQNKNNLFGLNAVDSSPGQSASYFESTRQCVQEFASHWMSKGYLNPEDDRYFGGFLGNKGSGINVKYASDPYWGEKAANIAWNLDERAGDFDQYAEVLAIKDIFPGKNTDLSIYAKGDKTSAVLYMTGSQSCSSYMLLESSAVNGFYKVQTDGIINEDRTGLADIKNGEGIYNSRTMYGYMEESGLTVVSRGRTPVNINNFLDISESDWYFPYVQYVFEHGIMTGMDIRTFGVMNTMKRAQFATIMYRIDGSPEVEYKACFPDVPEGSFYTSAAIWANENNVMTGYANGMFGGNDSINREQIATILYRYAQMKGYDTSAKSDISEYPDASAVNEFAKEAMQWAVAEKLIQGDQGYLNPQGEASRVHCATMVTRFMQRYVGD
ncbi:MAG: S-layer homology domain-containing protein [Schaedlerella sp.]|nr:S-layer homology domain-containing protein [Lachnospiraceae bacterium]MDY4202797.1 S-layer homology domain-containing protein [Schaedlerella sp.]